MKYPDRTMSRMIALTLSWLLSLQPLLVYADTRVVPQAGSGTTMDSSASQVPVVNIARPNSRGLSQNLYTRFDVGERGVVLNNSRAVTNTSIAGHITANPNLTTGHASIILNEVIQPNPSSLRGYLEVGGQNADVIVANPWGITCDGCGFINTQRGTLTTGRSLTGEDGSLLGFDIQGGEVAFEGRGLNARNMDYFSVLAQGIRLNAELYGSNLHLLGGEFQVDYDTLEVTVTSNPDTPRYAISSSELGGIYGDTIRLIATGEGVGVHLDAPVAAQTGSVVIDAEGRVRFSRVAAEEHVLVFSDEQITSEGSVTAGGTFHAAAQEVHFTNGVSGAEHVELLADKVAIDAPATLVADNMSIVADTLDNAGTLAATDTLLLQLQENYEHKGDVQADGHLVIASAQDIHIGEMENGQRWQVAGDVTLLAAGAVHNEGVLSSARTLTLEAGQVVNEGDMAGMQGVALRAGVIDNKSQSLLLSGADMSLEANAVFNQGDIYAVDNLVIRGLPVIAAGENDTETGTPPVLADEVGEETGAQSVADTTEPAVPWAMLLANKSGMIGTQRGTIDLFAEHILNGRAGEITIDVLQGEAVITWPDDLGQGAGKNEQCFHKNRNSGCKIVTFRQSTRTEYVDEEQLAALPRQGVILAGGDLTTHSHTLVNQYSAIGSYGDANIYLYPVDDAATDNTEPGNTGLADTTPDQAGDQEPPSVAGGVLLNEAWVQELTEQTVVDRSRYREGSRGGPSQKKKQYIYSTIPTAENPAFCSRDKVRCEQDQQHRVVFDPVIHIQTLLSAVIGAAGTLNIVGEQISNGEIDQGLSFMAAQQFMQGDAPSGDGLYRLDPLGSGFTLPGTHGLFVRAQNPHHPYLIETNPLFATHSGFMGSSYMLNRLGWHPEPGQQLLGDAFYELNLLQQALLGQPAPIGADQETREQFFTRLMDQGIAAAESLQLSPGISLTAEQINTLQEDIIWLEEREVAGHRVLVPVVYLAQGVAAPDAILHGNTVVLEAGSISSGGLIQSQDDLTLKATDGSIHTSGTLVAGNTLTLDASENIINLGGTLRGHDIELDAGGDIQLVTAYEHRQHGTHGITLLGNQATVEATGTLSMNSGGNTVLVGAQIDAGRLDVAAEGDVVAQAIAILRNYNANSKNADARLSSVRHLTTNIATALDALISTEQNLTLMGVNLTAGGDIDLQAEGDLVADAVKDEFYQYTRSVSTSGWGSSKSKTTTTEIRQTDLAGTAMTAGGKLSLNSGKDIRILASTGHGEDGVNVNAGRNLIIESGKNTDYERTVTTDKNLARNKTRDKGHDRETLAQAGFSSGAGITLDAADTVAIKGAALKAQDDLLIGDAVFYTDEDGQLLRRADGSLVTDGTGTRNVVVDAVALKDNDWDKTTRTLKGVVKALAEGVNINLAFLTGLIPIADGVKTKRSSGLDNANTIHHGSQLSGRDIVVLAEERVTVDVDTEKRLRQQQQAANAPEQNAPEAPPENNSTPGKVPAPHIDDELLTADGSTFDARGNILILAGQEIDLGSRTNLQTRIVTSGASGVAANTESYQHSTTNETVTTVGLNAGGDILLYSGGYLSGEAVQMNAGGSITGVGLKGITLNEAYATETESEISTERGGFGMTRITDDRRQTESIAVVSNLNAGKGITLYSEGDIVLRGTAFSPGEQKLNITSSEGHVVLQVVKDTVSYSHTKENSNAAWQSQEGHGYYDETTRYVALPEDALIEAAKGIQVEVGTLNEQTVEQAVEALIASGPEFAWLAQLQQEGGIDWQAVEEIHNQWAYDHQGMGPGLALAVSIAVTVLVSPAGGRIADLIGLGGNQVAIAASGAVVTGATNMVVTNAINNGGKLDSAISDLGSSDSLKILGASALTAGLTVGMDKLFDKYVQFGRDGVVRSNTTYGLTKGFNLGDGKGMLGFTLHNIGQAGLQAGVNSAVWGGSFNDLLKTSLESQGNDVLSALAFYHAGNLADNMPSTVEQMSWWKEGGAGKILLHAGVGGLVTEITHGDFASGAGAAAMNQILSPGMENLSEKWRPAGSQLAGMMGAGLMGGNYELGSWIGLQADAYNRQLHPEEKMLAKVLAKESNGSFTENEVEEALRWMPNKDKGELVGSNIVVDLQSEAMQGEGWKSLYYDHDGNWILLPGEDGEPRYMVQVPDAQVSPEVRDFIVSRTGGENSPYYDPVVYLPASRAQEAGFSPTPLVLVAGGSEYELSGINRDQACGSSRECLTKISSTPWHMGLIPVEQNGTTYYINVYDPKARSYLDKVYETTFQNMADAATVATIAYPVLTPATGPLAAGFTGLSWYYSDDKSGKLVDIGVGYGGGKFWRWGMENAGAPISSDWITRMENILGYLSGNVSTAVRED